ncbi:MAG TPA: two-component system response regulator [Sulfurospirillum sp. UBA11407]|nr:MAG TPA: two-component system response regulator [Sulfurospirillum sp. UBA11407]
MSYKVLFLEDNLLLQETLEDFLEEKDCEVFLSSCAKEALELCYKHKFDIYLFDVKLPDVSGFDFLQELRKANDITPTIFITSLEDKESLSHGFLSGGDDYIKKPFDLDELWLRMQAVIKRSLGLRDEKIYINNFTYLNLKRKNIVINEEEILLNLKDFELLHLLVSQRGKVVTKEMIEEKLWGFNEVPNSGSIRVYINNLKKIFGKDAITNIRGIGYRFEEF